MTGIISNFGVVPNQTVQAYQTSIPPIGQNLLYFKNGCRSQITPEQWNTLQSLIHCVIDKANMAYDATNLCQLYDAIKSISGLALATCSAAQPASPILNDLWMDDSANILKRWNGSTWSTIDPEDGPSGIICKDCTSLKLYFNCGSAYLELSSGGGGGSVGGITPIGGAIDYFGTVAPANWHFTDGTALSRTTYSMLFAAIGTTFGPGDGSTTFNLPDTRGRTTFSPDNMGGTNANRIDNSVTGIGDSLGGTGGSSITMLVEANLPNTSYPTTASVIADNGFIGMPPAPTPSPGTGIAYSSYASARLYPEFSPGSTVGTANLPDPYPNAASSPMSNMPPMLSANKIIRVL